jgi:catechol 2,3-dioxygenase-like lactoylglutathione lyase family enzyme
MPYFASIIPVLRVADLSRSLAWYRDHLGFTADEGAAAVASDACILRRDGTELMLRRVAPGSPAVLRTYDWDVYIRLSGGELTQLLDHARRTTPLVRGPEIMPSGHVEFELEDPDGHRVCVAEALADTRGFPLAVA